MAASLLFAIFMTVILRPVCGRRISRDVAGLIAVNRLSGQGLLLKSRGTTWKSDTFREVLRPKDGLRMTVL
jgi:hypothetical protein